MVLKKRCRFCVSQGSVETFFSGGGKRLYYIVANLFSGKFIWDTMQQVYQKKRSLTEDNKKNFWFTFCWDTVLEVRKNDFAFYKVV